MSAQPPNDWLLAALKVTGHFEDSSDPLGAVTGDFDGMGISVGVLQWNIGSGSLQPMVKALGRDAVVAALPTCGQDLWTACNSARSQGLEICRGWQSGATLHPTIRNELKAFARGDLFLPQQMAQAGKVAGDALAAAKAYTAQQGPGAVVSKAVFCWFFDVYTQNGGLKGLDHDDVRAFVGAHPKDKADDFICDWLAGRNSAFAGFKDSLRNAVIWRDKVPAAKLGLFVLSYLRSQKSRLEYRADVLNRKATIALGHGVVHGETHDLTALLGP